MNGNLKIISLSTAPLTTPKVALILGGGAARGFAHIGVLAALHRANIPIDLIIGNSVGSIVGALYAFDQNIERLKKFASHAKRRDFFRFTFSRAWQGISDGKEIYQFIEKETEGASFKKLKIPLIITAVDLKSGELITMAEGCVAKSVQASCALPPFYSPVQINERLLIDGGALSPCPVEVATLYQAKLKIAVPIATSAPIDKISGNLVSTLLRFEQLRESRLSQIETTLADIIIAPDLKNHGLFDFRNIEGLIALGEKSAIEALPAIEKAVDTL